MTTEAKPDTRSVLMSDVLKGRVDIDPDDVVARAAQVLGTEPVKAMVKFQDDDVIGLLHAVSAEADAVFGIELRVELHDAIRFSHVVGSWIEQVILYVDDDEIVRDARALVTVSCASEFDSANSTALLTLKYKAQQR